MTRKEICRQLAGRLAQEEPQEAFRWLQLLGFVGSEPVGPSPSPRRDPESVGDEETPQPISIWQPRQIQGKWVFERPEPDPLGDHFASTRRWSATKAPGQRRVCFFGESVAAGYLYAPHVTPAKVLDRCLTEGSEEKAFEVVDLARTNETLTGLLTTVRSSLQLAPDILVIFAGNNWNLLETPETSPYLPAVQGRQRYGEVLQRGGPKGLARWAQRRLEHKATGVLEEIALLARQREIPVVWVLPEVNLAHWHSRQPVAWLPGDGSQQWHEWYRIGGEALRREKPREAEEAARKMLDLDAGSCPTSHRLLAEALMAQGHWEDAEAACRAEVDAESYATLCFLGSPRANQQVRRVVESFAQREGFVLVDLPKIFRRATLETSEGEEVVARIPGRRLFLDYCHLTLEGIDLAMAAVAESVRSVLTGQDSGTWATGGSSSIAFLPTPLAPEAEALAALGAAIHSAHRLLSICPKSELLEFWSRRAFSASPRVVEAFRDLVAARGGPIPVVLNEAHGRNRRSSFPLSLQHGWKWEYLDAELLRALLATLEDLDPGACADLQEEIVRGRGLSRDFVDLSRPPFLWEPLERFYPDVMPHSGLTGRATLRCPWPTTDFCLVTSGGAEVHLEVELRLPLVDGMKEAREGEVALEVDGNPLASLSATAAWSIHRLTVPPSLLSKGLHQLTFRWPHLPSVGDLAQEAAVRRLQLGVEADLHPVFGEIFRLRGRLHP